MSLDRHKTRIIVDNYNHAFIKTSQPVPPHPTYKSDNGKAGQKNISCSYDEVLELAAHKKTYEKLTHRFTSAPRNAYKVTV